VVACPRNQLYLEHEVAGFCRPLAVSGSARHSSQVALQRDLQLIAVRLEQDRFDQPSNGIRSAGAPFFLLQGVTEAGDLLPIDIGHRAGARAATGKIQRFTLRMHDDAMLAVGCSDTKDAMMGATLKKAIASAYVSDSRTVPTEPF